MEEDYLHTSRVTSIQNDRVHSEVRFPSVGNGSFGGRNQRCDMQNHPVHPSNPCVPSFLSQACASVCL